MTNHIYAYEKMPDDLEVNGVTLTDWEDLPEINRILNNKFSFYGNYKIDGKDVGYLKKGNFIKALDQDLRWKYFEIYDIVKNLNSYSVTARTIGYMANRNFIEYSFTSAGNGTKIMNNLKAALAFKQPFNYLSNVPTVHQFTVKQAKPIEAIIGSNNGSQNLVGVTAAELDMDNYDLKLVKQIGADNGYRIDFGINLEAVEEEINEDNVYNSLFLVGGVPGNDYDDNKEPITYKYLEIKGVTDANRRIGKREDTSITDVDELIEWGQSLFDVEKVHEAKVTHTVSMVSLEHTLEYGDLYSKLSHLHFGDVAYCNVKKLGIEVKERMVEYTWFPTLGKFKQIVLGNDLSLYTNKVNAETQQLKSKIENRTEVMVQNILNATAWITGNRGGHVIFRPEKAPSEILIMDTRDVATAKRVWRWNLNGLGYSDNGINGPYGIAMTSKGEIVADFIKVGTIVAEVFESSFNAYGDILKLVAGALQAWNDGRKIMELTKRGLEFWYGDSQVGTIGTFGNPFPELVNSEGIPVIEDGNSLLITTYDNQRLIGLSARTSYGILLNDTQTSISANHLSIFSPDGSGTKMILSGDLDITGSLRVNGQPVTGGGSGGPGDGGGFNGKYPPELTSDRDKRYWIIWICAINAGCSPAAAAALCGNAQGESDGNPRADESGGAPGYGYGIFQWTLWGSNITGRQYMIQLMDQAGITDDPDTSVAQMKLLFWHAPNGQWIATSAYPYSWNQFMTLTNIATATRAFEENFERPRDDHPERIGWAQSWYNKFVNLKQPGGAFDQGFQHIESLLGKSIGNGECYALVAEYAGYLGGPGLDAGTQYAMSDTTGIGSTAAASDIGIAYNWAKFGWIVIQNPSFDQLQVGAIINIARGGSWANWSNGVSSVYGHTGIIKGLGSNSLQTYEQNTEQGRIIGSFNNRPWTGSNNISSIVIPPK